MTDGRTDGRTDPNYRKASLLKRMISLVFKTLGGQQGSNVSNFESCETNLS